MQPVPPPRLRQDLPRGDVPKFGSRSARVPEDLSPLGHIKPEDLRRASTTLEPVSGRMGTFVLLTIASLVWNGVTWTFVVILVGSLFGQTNAMPRGMSIFGTLFLLPFVAIGLVLIGSAIHAFLGLFNPRPILRSSRTAIAPGETFEIDWEVPERATRLKKVVVTLHCREEAVYTVGTDTRTDVEEMLEVTVSEVTNVLNQRLTGSAQVSIPPDAMHSFKHRHNRIIWSLKLHGEIPRWPDIDLEYEIYVVPPTMVQFGGGGR